MLLDATAIQKKAKEELAKEAGDKAKEKLKELYIREEKAALALRNIRREIDLYLADVADLAVYEAAGVDTSK